MVYEIMEKLALSLQTTPKIVHRTTMYKTPRKNSLHLQGIHSNTIIAFLTERSKLKVKKFRHGEIEGGWG
jgi:hypothetical protein